jgi:hypothetical protein
MKDQSKYANAHGWRSPYDCTHRSAVTRLEVLRAALATLSFGNRALGR